MKNNKPTRPLSTALETRLRAATSFCGFDPCPWCPPIIRGGLVPHTRRIEAAHAHNRVAVVFFEIDPEYADHCRSTGWKGGRSECVVWDEDAAERYASALASITPVDIEEGTMLANVAAWLRRDVPGRIFVHTALTTVALNLDDNGLSGEPDTHGGWTDPSTYDPDEG